MPKAKNCSDRIPENTVDPEVFADMDNFDLVNNPTAFANSLRFQFPKFSKGFTTSDFEEFVQEHVGVENLKSIGRLNFPNEWQMEVESKAVREKLIRWGKTKIKNRSCWITPLCSSEIRGFVHWLPSKLPNQKVKDFLSDYGEVLFVEHQKQTLWGGKVNSDARYFALYLRAGKSKEDLPHFTKLENFNCLVIVRGRCAACFHCRQPGHRKNDCKKFKDKINGYCGRPAKSAKQRTRPRGLRFNPEIEDSEILSDKTAVASSVSKQKSTDGKISIEKKEMNTSANSEGAAVNKTTESKVSTDKEGKNTFEGPVANKTTNSKVSTNKKEKKTSANSEGAAAIITTDTKEPGTSNAGILTAAEELNLLKIKMAELFSTHISNLENKLSMCPVPPVDATPAATEEVPKKKKKKKSKKKSEAIQSESLASPLVNSNHD